MEVLAMEGSVPGPVAATVVHRGAVRQVGVTVDRHPDGGWRARATGGRDWTPRCRSVATAILLLAGESFSAETPMLVE